MLRSDILDRCTAVLGDTSEKCKTLIRDALNDCMQELWYLHNWDWKIAQTTLATTGATEYTLNAAVDQLIEMHIPAHSQTVQRQELVVTLEDDPAQATTGVPTKYYFTASNKIKFDVTATSGLTVNYTYIKKYTALTNDSDDIETEGGIPEKYQSGLIDGVLSVTAAYMGDYNLSQMSVQKWDMWKGNSIRQHESHYDFMPQFVFDM